MARDRKRVRTVIVRLLPVASTWTVPTWTVPTRTAPTWTVPTWMCASVARRLLVVVAVAAGGWLLGGAGHAHAESLPRPGVGAPSAGARGLPDPVAVRAPVDVTEAADVTGGADVTESMARRPHPERQVRRSPASAARSVAVTLSESLHRPAGRAAGPATTSVTEPVAALIAMSGAISHDHGNGGLGRDLRGARQTPPLRSSTVLGAPARVWRAVSDFASIGSWTAGRLPGLPWTPRHRAHAGAGTGERTGARVPVLIAATGASKDGRAAAGAEARLPAASPDPGSRQAPVPQGGALLTAGPALMGGAIAYISRTRSGAHARAVPASLSGVGAPAVQSSSDEPAFSPD